MSFSLFGRGAEAPALQLYGKLPIAKDYLRIGCAEDGALQLRDWLDQTFGAVRDSEESLELEEPMRFMIGGKDPLQGMIWPSTDAGGHRVFPFTLCVERKAKRFSKDLEAGLVQAESVWRSLAGVYGECQVADEGRDLLDAQRGREITIEPEGDSGSNCADFNIWLDTLWPEEGRVGMGELLAAIAQLVDRKERGPFRLPLLREMPLRDQVLAWRGLFVHLGLFNDDEPGTFFFPAAALIPSSEPGFLLIGAGPLNETWAQWLTTTAGSEALGDCDFCGELFGEISAGERSLDPDLDEEKEDAAPLLASFSEFLPELTERRSR